MDVRLFVAAEVPLDLRSRLEAVQGDLQELPWRVRWVRKEAMHLTFVFLGEIDPSHLEPLEQALGQPEPASVGRFRLVVRGLGAFPTGGKPRVLWAGIAGDLQAAGRLKEALDAALGARGFPVERRAFKPHLTLGRVVECRGPARRSILESFAATEFGSFEVDSCVLFESRLLPQGAQHAALRRFPLDAAAPTA